MSKDEEEERNPPPSYIVSDDCELYLTDPSEAFNCKYCRKTGHMQAESKKNANQILPHYKIIAKADIISS